MRDSSSLGTFCWSAVSQVIPEMVKLSAPTKAQAISHGRASRRPSASSGSPLSPPRSRLVRSGRRSTSRYMSTLISSRPTALVLSTRPQAASPLRCRVRSGPSICHGPTLIRLMAQNDRAMAETQRMERKARQPSRMSAVSRGRRAATGAAAAGSTGSRTKNAAAAMKLTASRATAQPPPTPTTSRPAAVGPRILAPFWVEASSELARCMSPGWTRSGTMPRRAGDANASRAPLPTSSAAITGRL